MEDKKITSTVIINEDSMTIPDGYRAVEILTDGTIVLEEIKEKTWENFGSLKNHYRINSKCEVVLMNNVISSKQNRNSYPTKELGEASIALSQLLYWRDKINGDWLPQHDYLQNKNFGIIIIDPKGKITVTFTKTSQSLLSFKTIEIAKQFYDDHLTLIRLAKPLLIMGKFY